MVPDARAAGAQTPDGAQVYKESRCFACHGDLGTGGFGPTLSGNPMLALDQYVVAQILIGRGQMPAFADKLSDQQIAAVADYIRNNWGNQFGPVSADEVGKVRQLMNKALANAPQTMIRSMTQSP
jgi:mono/diheme cytochrome c family protein